MNIHVVQFTLPSSLGLSLYDVESSAVLPAYAVMTAIEKPRLPRTEPGWNNEWAWKRYDDVIEELRDLGGAMVEIVAAGAVVGDWIVRPYLIGSHEYRLLRAAMAMEH